MKNFDGLRLALGAMLGNCVFEYHDTLTSTQVRARELAAGGAARAVVAAGEQTAGRGRGARGWVSPKGGGLYFSILSRPMLPPESIHMVNIAAALATASAVKSVLALELELKWPNDLLILHAGEYRKVCGILSESALRGGPLGFCVTGIGLNLCAPASVSDDLKNRAGWLCENGAAIDQAELLSRVVKNFFDLIGAMEREGTAPILFEYRERCASVGRVVKVESGSETLTGLCSGIGENGELLLETPEGTRRFHAADVTHAGLEEHK